MTKATETGGATAPIKLSRIFQAPRATMFLVWSSADHVQRWFSPDGFTVPHADVQMRVGGPFILCMRAPDGTEYWIRGSFTEIRPDTRLVIDMLCTDGDGGAQFRAYTEVDFSDVPGGTRLEVTQSYTLIDPTKAWMLAGAPEGWRGTLDKLGREVARIQQGAARPG